MKKKLFVVVMALLTTACGGSSGGNSGSGAADSASAKPHVPSGTCTSLLNKQDHRSIAISFYRMKGGCGLSGAGAEQMADVLL